MERRHNETSVGSVGWALLAGGVFLWDKLAEESLSHAYKRGIHNSLSRPFCLGALAVTAAHLLDVIPHEPVEFDPYRWLRLE
jgi:hypothetical protein